MSRTTTITSILCCIGTALASVSLLAGTPGTGDAADTLQANTVWTGTISGDDRKPNRDHERGAVLRITSRKGGEWDEKDGAVHTFTITALKDKGWNFRLKDGIQKFPVVAPAEPGTYVVECTVKCGKGHDDMKMKLVVTP